MVAARAARGTMIGMSASLPTPGTNPGEPAAAAPARIPVPVAISPDVRAELVAELRQLVASNRYEVPAELVALALIRSVRGGWWEDGSA